MGLVDVEVIIIGAGSTGLLLAQGLQAAGLRFRIFERHGAAHTSREWSMSLHWGGEFLTQVLPASLRARLAEINVDPAHDFSGETGFVQCNGATGDVLLVMPGTMPRRVSRRKLRRLMAEGVAVEHDKTLVDFTIDTAQDTVTAHFADGTATTARVLVGADGSRSRTRTLMLADESLSAPSPTPYTLVNFPFAYPPAIAAQLRAIHPVFKVAYHPALNMMFMSSLLSAPDPVTGAVSFQNLLSWKGAPSAETLRQDPPALLRRFKELGAQFAGPFRAAAEAVPDGFEGVFVDRGAQWDPRPHYDAKQATWNGREFGGRVTLVGDAAHAMLPHRGQGLNHALEDAARLLAALRVAFKPESGANGSPSLQSAVAAYETEMVARAGLEVEVTAKAAVAAHNWDMLMQSPMFKHGANKTQ